MLAIAAFVLLANLLYLLDFFDPNPLGPRGALASSNPVGVFGGQPTIDPNNGFISQAISHLAVRDLVHLQLPWWNPFEGTGMALAGQLQSAAFFPPSWLTLISNGQLYEHILLELVAGLATYRLLRRLAVSPWAAAAGGIAFALNGTFAWFSHAPVNPVAFLPLLLVGLERAYDAATASARGGWGLIAIAGVLSFYAGFPEVTYIDTLFALCWFVWRAGCLPRARLRAFLGKAAAGAAAASLLGAPLLIAMISHFSRADQGLHTSALLGSAHFGTQALPQLIMPYIYGPIFDFTDQRGVLSGLWGSVGGYLTATLLLFAMLGLFSRGRRALRIILLAWIVLVFARMYGLPHVLFGVLGVLPNMSHIAFFRYATPSLDLPLVILAAFGIDAVVNAPARQRRVIIGAGVTLVLVALAVLEARTLTRMLPARFHQRPYLAGTIAWTLLTVSAAVAIGLLFRPRWRAPLLAAVLAIDSLAMFVAPELSAPRTVQLDLAPVSYLQQHLGMGRFFTLGPLAPNYGSYFRLRELNVNDFPPKAFASYVRTRLDQVVDPTVFVGNNGGGRPIFAPSPSEELLRNLDGYREAGVAYVLASSVVKPLAHNPSLTLVFRSPTTLIYRLSGTKPYFSATTSRCTVSFRSAAAARTDCATPAALVRRETAFPGWSAEVDGHPAQIRTTDGVFQSVEMPSGVHRVRFTYEPPYIWWGYGAFAAGSIWLLVASGAPRLRELGRRRRVPASS